MKVDTIQTSFASGELAPSLFGRTDIAQYQNAAAIVENMLVRPYGTLISTPGTEYISACKTGGSTSTARLLQFIFSKTDSYIIEMGDAYFRFYTNGAVVVSSGSTPYELAHTYTAAQVADLHYSQINDLIYIVHPSHPPRKLTRLSSNNWTLTDVPFLGGPFAPDNYIYSNSTTFILTSATITPSATAGSITLSASNNIFIASGSTLGHVNTFWKINSLVTNSTTGLQEQGYVRITAITNPSTATATVIKTLKAASATTTWAQGSWSDVLGWPARVTFHQQRLFMARTAFQPQNIWGSQSFSYENFAVNGGSDDDALDIQIASVESNQINWITSGENLTVGTYGGDFVIRSGDDSPLTPANTNAFKVSSWGSETVQPKRIGNFIYYVQRFSRKIREFFYDSYSTQNNKSIDATILSPHIAGNGFKEIAYQQNPDTVLWAICSNGTIATFTREIDQEVSGWSRQTTDGSYESIASIPSATEPHDEIWVIVKRTINSETVRYVERFKSQIVPDLQYKSFYVHSGLTYDTYNATSTPTSTSMSFSYPSNPTKLLIHCNGIDGSQVFTESSSGKAVSVSGSAQIVNSTKVFGTGSIYFPNIAGNDANTKLLLHLDNNVTDSSSSAKTVTNNSVTFSTAIKQFGGYSAAFNGASSYLSVADSADWDLGTGDFTIDFWFYITSTPATRYGLFVQYSAGEYYAVNYHSDNTIQFAAVSATGLNINQYTGGVSIGVLHHYAVVRSGNTFTCYVDGLQKWTTTSALGMPSSSGEFRIGMGTDGTGYLFNLNGYIDEFRFSKGVARWTEEFTVPDIAYSSTNDSISLVDSTDWQFGTGDFTIDFWTKLRENGAMKFMGQYLDANNNWSVYLDSSNRLTMLFYDASAVKALYSTGTNAITKNTGWAHIAFVRSSSTGLIFINGVSQTVTSSPSFATTDVGTTAAPLFIGQEGTNTSYLKGWLDEIRITRSALWASDFTVPTSEGSLTGTVALVTSSATYFTANSVGKRLRAIDANGEVSGEMNIVGYTSGTIVVGNIVEDFDSQSYAAGRWGISATTISGLSHLNGETVTVLADGVPDTPNKVVSSGSITLSTDRFYVNAGLPYTQKVQTLPQEAATQRGTAQGKLQRINQLGIKVNRSYSGFSVGPDEDSLKALTAISPSLYTGVISNVFYYGGYSYGSQVWLENSVPLPIELLSLTTTLDTQEK